MQNSELKRQVGSWRKGTSARWVCRTFLVSETPVTTYVPFLGSTVFTIMNPGMDIDGSGPHSHSSAPLLLSGHLCVSEPCLASPHPRYLCLNKHMSRLIYFTIIYSDEKYDYAWLRRKMRTV